MKELLDSNSSQLFLSTLKAWLAKQHLGQQMVSATSLSTTQSNVVSRVVTLLASVVDSSRLSVRMSASRKARRCRRSIISSSSFFFNLKKPINFFVENNFTAEDDFKVPFKLVPLRFRIKTNGGTSQGLGSKARASKLGST